MSPSSESSPSRRFKIQPRKRGVSSKGKHWMWFGYLVLFPLLVDAVCGFDHQMRQDYMTVGRMRGPEPAGGDRPRLLHNLWPCRSLWAGIFQLDGGQMWTPRAGSSIILCLYALFVCHSHGAQCSEHCKYLDGGACLFVIG